MWYDRPSIDADGYVDSELNKLCKVGQFNEAQIDLALR